MLKIRLQRVGRKHDPQFRIVVTEHTRAAKKGNIVEALGTFNPKLDTRVVDAERVKYWMSVGAQPSDSVHNILVENKILKDKKRNVLPKKTPIVKEETENQAEAPAEAKKEEAPSAKEKSVEADNKEELAQDEVAAPALEKVEEPAPAVEVKSEEVKEETPAEESKVKGG